MKLSSVAVLFGAAVAAFFPGASADSVVSFVLFLCFVQVVSNAFLLFGAGMSVALVMMMNACCICILHAASCVYPGVCVTLPHLFLTFTFSSYITLSPSLSGMFCADVRLVYIASTAYMTVSQRNYSRRGIFH